MINDKYKLRGVSAKKEEVHEAIKGMDKGLFSNAFCKILNDISCDETYCNIIHNDTAGTKTSLAYIYSIESNDTSIWRGIAQDALVMNLDDMACVGVTENFLISSTIGRNKSIIDGKVIKEVIQGTNDFINSMKPYQIEIVHGGGETADVGDIVRTIDVGITAFARLKKEDLIINQIKPGNVILGIAGFGQSTYENEYNSGIGSNGLTMARHDLLAHKYAEKYPESYSPEIDKSVVYSGSLDLSDVFEPHQISIGKLLLSPTRTFLPVFKKIFETHRKQIDGIIHCTGGGQTKVLHFIDNLHVIKNNLFEPPPIFKLIQKESNSSWQEMYQVFNMGNRMEIYCEENIAREIIPIIHSFNIDAQIIGSVEAFDGKKVTVESEFGKFEYK